MKNIVFSVATVLLVVVVYIVGTADHPPSDFVKSRIEVRLGTNGTSNVLDDYKITNHYDRIVEDERHYIVEYSAVTTHNYPSTYGGPLDNHTHGIETSGTLEFVKRGGEWYYLY